MKRLFLCAVLAIASLNLLAQEREHKAMVDYFSGFKDFKEISFAKTKDLTIGEMISEKIDFFDKLSEMDSELSSMENSSNPETVDRISKDSSRLLAFLQLYSKYIERSEEVIARIYSIRCTYTNDSGEKRDVTFEGLFTLLGELTAVRVKDYYWQYLGSVLPNYIIPEFRDILFSF